MAPLNLLPPHKDLPIVKSFDELLDQIVSQGLWWTESPLAQSLKKPIVVDSSEPVDDETEEADGD